MILSVSAFARDFQTERPTRVRTPYTLNKSDVALESEIINFRADEETKSHETSFAKSLFRYGMTSHTEVQAEITPYSRINQVDGLGDTRLNIKSNLMGNDQGQFILSYGAYLDLPTSGGNLTPERIEGGLFLPMGFIINNDWATAMTIEFNNIPRSASWQTNLEIAFALTYTLLKNTALILEIFNGMGLNKEESNNTTLDIALQYSLSEKMKFDLGFFKGLSPDSKDEEVFTGVSFLF